MTKTTGNDRDGWMEKETDFSKMYVRRDCEGMLDSMPAQNWADMERMTRLRESM